MPLKDLSGKTVFDLEKEDFEKLFCQQCNDYHDCPIDDVKIRSCKILVDCGLWDRYYRKN